MFLFFSFLPLQYVLMEYLGTSAVICSIVLFCYLHCIYITELYEAPHSCSPWDTQTDRLSISAHYFFSYTLSSFSSAESCSSGLVPGFCLPSLAIIEKIYHINWQLPSFGRLRLCTELSLSKPLGRFLNIAILHAVSWNFVKTIVGAIFLSLHQSEKYIRQVTESY